MNILKPEKKTQIKQKTRKPRLYRQALCLVSILSLIIVQAGALLLRPVPVLASEGGTAYNIAGYILSILTSYNTAITNQQVVNSIVSTFGNMDCATASAAQIETGLATIAQSTGFDLAPIFATTAEEAAEVAAVYEGWGETAIAAASASTNIEAGARGLALAAAGGAGAAVLPVVGGVVIPAAASVALGVAGGFLIDHIINKISNYVKNGVPLTTPESVFSKTFGYGLGYINSPDKPYIAPQSPYVSLYFITGNNEYGIFYNSATNVGNLSAQYNSTSYLYSPAPAFVDWYSQRTRCFTDSYNTNTYGNTGFMSFSSLAELDNYITSIRNGEIDFDRNHHSPDILGDNGFQTGNNTDNGYNMPYVYPVYNYGNTVINYINPSDYQNFINDNPDTGTDFDTFVNPYIQPISNPEPDPDPEPEPTSVPQPTSEPIVGVNPVPNPQPTSAPLPTPSTEEQEQLPEGMTNPDWKEKFPFCIPYDILAFMQIWQEARAAPRFEFDLSFGTNGKYGLGVVVIDLAPFDSAAQLLRLLQLILFIVGLAIGTHKLLNPSGGGGD